jgi:hypothetical protein
MTSWLRPLPFLALLVAAPLVTGCEADLDEEAAAPPDTVVHQAGPEGARDACRQLVREQLGLPRERIAIQEDGLVQSRGGGRFHVDGLARVLGEDGRTTEAVYRFDCVVRYDEAAGWAQEELDLSPTRHGGGEPSAGTGAEASGG